MDRYTLVEADGRTTRPVKVGQSTILGKGGEAVVHLDPDHPQDGALKIYHEATADRESKIREFLKRSGKFPSTVMAPRAFLLDSKDSFAGFGMPQLSPGFVPIKELFNKKFCGDHGITAQIVSDLLLTAGENLAALHPNQITVGDLNDGGIAFHKTDHSVAWMDVDSWDIPGYPCIVGTQMYLCPALFGIDLSKNQSGSHFESWHDWYSWSVLLFRALLRKHPFKSGKHPVHKGMIERAQNGIHVLHSEVKYPPAGLPAEMLSDELAHELIQHLSLAKKGAFDLDILRHYRESLAACGSCGMWYPTSRPNCPNCSEKTTVDLSKLLGVLISEFIESQGRILHVQVAGKVVYCIAEESGKIVLYRKEQTLPVSRQEIKLAFQPGMRFGFFRDTLVICTEGDEFGKTGSLFLLDVSDPAARPKPVTKSTTGKLAGAGNGAVFATSRRYLYRLSQNMIIREERFLEKELLPRPVTQVSEGQSWFTVDPNPGSTREVLFGFSRDTRKVQWFVCTSNHEGKGWNRTDVDVPQLENHESMVDFSVRFTGSTVLLMRRTRKQGQELVRLDRVAADTGKVEASEILDLNDHPHWENVHGKALLRGIVMHSTSDDGIVRETLKDHRVKPLGGSASVVTSDEELFPYEGGVLVRRSGRIDLVTPK